MDKSAKNKEKNQRQRKRRYHNRNGVPYYGSWWAGVTNPDAVHDSQHFFSGGGTTEMSGGGSGGGGEGGSVAASIKESVFMEGLRQMGYLGCFYCERPVENVPNLVVSRFTTTEYFVPCCTDCKSGR